MMNAIWGGKTNPLEERLEAIEHQIQTLSVAESILDTHSQEHERQKKASSRIQQDIIQIFKILERLDLN